MYIKLSSPFVSSNVVICKQKHVFGDGALTIKYSARNTAFHSIKRLVEERIAQEFYINFNNPLLTIRIAFCKTLTHYIHNLQCGYIQLLANKMQKRQANSHIKLCISILLLKINQKG